MKKDTIIAILAIACLIELFVIFGHDKPASLSIEEKVQILYDYGCELDYKAIEKFAEEWDLYVESAWGCPASTIISLQRQLFLPFGYHSSSMN